MAQPGATKLIALDHVPDSQYTHFLLTVTRTHKMRIVGVEWKVCGRFGGRRNGCLCVSSHGALGSF